MECIISNPMLVTWDKRNATYLLLSPLNEVSIKDFSPINLIMVHIFSSITMDLYCISRVHRKLCLCQAREIQQDPDCNCIRFGRNLWCLYSSIILPLHSVPVADIKMLRKTQKEEFKQWLQWPDRWAIFYAGLLITQ